MTRSLAEAISQRDTPPSGERGDSIGGSRGAPICVISPGEQERGERIWSDRPLFLWKTQQQEPVEQITLLHISTQEVIWEQSLSPTTQQIAYTGEALEPGEDYQWKLSSGTEDSTTINWDTAWSFKVMEVDRRNLITAELQRIETELSNGHASVEVIALEKAQYLQDQGLRSDAIQVLYVVPNPSAIVNQTIQRISSSFCPSAE